MKCSPKKTAKTLIFQAGDKVVVVVVRGDREINEVKVSNAVNATTDLEMASESAVKEATRCSFGFVGPMGIKV